MKPLALTFCTIFLTSALGCVTSPAGLTSSTLPITAKDSYTVIQENVVGADSTLKVFGIGIPYNSYKALQHAKENGQCDALINVTCENKSFWITLVVPLITWETIVIRGDAIKFQRGGALSE